MDLTLKFQLLIAKLGKMNLSRELKVSYNKFKLIEKNLDTLTIAQLKIIDNLYSQIYE